LKNWYYYLHENGSLIGKNPAAVDALGAWNYFDSSFVKKWWFLDLENRLDAWNFVLDAAELGASESDLKKLYKDWGLTQADSNMFMLRSEEKVMVYRDDIGLWRRKK
jgi:hypothetical protein